MVQKSLIQALYTERTCGDPCWYAREDVCRCSCAGRNHGCLRRADGTEQPPRTRRVGTARYQLYMVQARDTSCRAVGTRPIYDTENRIIDMARKAHGLPWHTWAGPQAYEKLPRPAKVTTATESSVRAWPELAEWRNPRTSWDRPLLLWINQDYMNLVQEE